MSVEHYLVFVGASVSLAAELNVLTRANSGLKLIAPAAPKGSRGVNPKTAQASLDNLVARLAQSSSHREAARLTIWFYGPHSPEEFQLAWSLFGKSAWIELVPLSLLNKDQATRLYIEGRLPKVLPLIHEVSNQIFNRRKTSPFSLPLTNFHSSITQTLSEYWYNQAELTDLQKRIQKANTTFRQFHWHMLDDPKEKKSKRKDDRRLIFSPAEDTQCHGQPHPIGSGKCFIDGRFRFGAALFPGFHYDVRKESGNLDVTLYNCDGNPRDLSPEKREYINVFPSDHILPDR